MSGSEELFSKSLKKDEMEYYEHVSSLSEAFETLPQFVDWVFSSEGPGLEARIPLLSSPRFAEGLCSIILGRWGSFQIEQVICRKNFRGFYHSQKECERIGVALSGALKLCPSNGQAVTTEEHFKEVLREEYNHSEITSIDEHSGGFHHHRLVLPYDEDILFEVKEYGAVFLIFEKTHNGDHHSILDDFIIEDL